MSDTPPGAPEETATRIFVGHRELLFSIVYNMLGSVADTEDVLQETWLAWVPRSRSPTGGQIENPRAYLVRIAVNRALARQATISRRREEYVGPWLPEPLVTPPDGAPIAADAGDASEPAVRAESVSMALLVVLETLTPLERAVFVLNEVFGYAHTEIAGILDRSPSAIRQLAHRAREHVHARRPRYQADPRVRRQVTERFLAAVMGGDLNALMEVLAPEVTLWADGGGKARAAGLRPIHGRDKVARLIIGDSTRRPIRDLGVRIRSVNGDPSALLMSGDALFAVIVLDLTPDGGQVRGVYAVTNPDKLSHVG
ncbi:RNA polymerase sigma factor SigJ [Sphaerisporangium sp. NPDC088356]|uniref:RNA polymerase sigma factor SigJ n=1 Tax=Sphaerisporangium sp. NPDC088356 TaxID=3154871 RepID=UPI003443F3A3